MTHSSSDLYTSVSDSMEKVVLKRTTEVENYWDKLLQRADENERQEIVHLRHVTSKSERKCIDVAHGNAILKRNVKTTLIFRLFSIR